MLKIFHAQSSEKSLFIRQLVYSNVFYHARSLVVLTQFNVVFIILKINSNGFIPSVGKKILRIILLISKPDGVNTVFQQTPMSFVGTED